ncbi:nucleotidyltransferase family protein [Roseivirga sp. E12]|uniref:nucleotidyltransferase domain-containing protein n=1 Tax=Roseivirga sp. E12 TaxID=2819237 RepID=UPI001ABC2796|nr:nucleotidyltransferase family protein [Roseivirga sp. E12]MBO3699066.1 nucleotidyltransferase family protein [Roseivirga sp. E12]
MKLAVGKRITQNTEWRALLHFCHIALHAKDFDQPCDFDIDTIDWLKFERFTTYHSVRPLVFQGMYLWNDRRKIPQKFFNKFETLGRRQSYVNMDHAREMVQLIGLISKKGLEVIPYKGVILARQAYGDIGLREMSDVDLLMKLEDFSTIRDVLLKRGYVASKDIPEHFEEKFFKQNFEYNFDLYEAGKRKYHVEPHWKIGFKRWQTDLDYLDIFPFTRKQDFFGTSINMLTPEGLLLTTSLHHGGEDRWNRLKYICDIAAILLRFNDKIDWQFLLIESEKLKVRNIVLLGVSLAHELFEIEIPQQSKRVIQNRTIQKHTRQVIKQLWVGEHSANVNTYFKDIRFHFTLRQFLSTRLKVLYYHITQVFVPTVYDINEESNKGKKYWWLFLTKPFRIWRTHVKINKFSK